MTSPVSAESSNLLIQFKNIYLAASFLLENAEIIVQFLYFTVISILLLNLIITLFIASIKWLIKRFNSVQLTQDSKMDATSDPGEIVEDEISEYGAFAIKNNLEIGKHWIATQNIKQGSLLLEELPIFYGPRWTEATFNFVPNCLTCGIYMEFARRRRCKNCHWPICSQKCSQREIHAKTECQIFSQQKIKYPPLNLTPSEVCEGLSMMRGLSLKTQSPSTYQQLLNLQDYSALDNFNIDLGQSARKAVLNLKNLVPLLEFNLSDYEQIFRILIINSFGGSLKEQVPLGHTEDEDSDSKLAPHIYLVASRMNSCCIPNCSWSIGSFPDLKIKIRATVAVQKGQELTITYTHLNSTLDTFGRQMGLRNGYGFICKCLRCESRTEMETFASAITCPVCKEGEQEGYFLPFDPLKIDPNGNDLYQCNNCFLSRPSKELAPLIQLLSMQLDSGILAKKEEFYKNFIQNYSGPLLHKNHWILQKATRMLIDCLIIRKNSMTKLEMVTFVNLLKYLQNIEDMTMPGLSESRVLAMRSLSTIVLTLLTRFGSTMTPVEFSHWSEICKKVQLGALTFFQLDASDRNGMEAANKLSLEIEILDRCSNQ